MLSEYLEFFNSEIHLSPYYNTARYKYAYNPSGVNKIWDYARLTTDFVDDTGSLADILGHVKAGHAVNGSWFGGQRRSKGNVRVAGVWFGDVDNTGKVEAGTKIDPRTGKEEPVYEKIYRPTLTLSEAITHPFVLKHVAAIYTSASHTDDWHKFRLVVPFDEAVDVSGGNFDRYEAIFDVFSENLPPGTLDPACRDVGRVLYGNTGAIFWINPNPIESISADAIDKAIAKMQAEEEESYDHNTHQYIRSLGDDRLKALALEAAQFLKGYKRLPKSGNYHTLFRIVAAVGNQFSDWDAHEILSIISPDADFDFIDSSGKPYREQWRLSKIIRSVKKPGYPQSKRVPFSYFFYLAQKHGWEPPQELSRGKAEDFKVKCQNVWRGFHKLNPDVILPNERGINIKPPEKGEMMIISAGTGVGKTTKLKEWVNGVWKDKRVIFFGNRNSTLMQLGEDLGAYHIRFDDEDEWSFEHESAKLLSCVDSIHRFHSDVFDENTVIVLDEFDTTIEHILLSMERVNNNRFFEFALQKSGIVLGLSATAANHHVDFLRSLAPEKKTTVFSNPWQITRPDVVFYTGGYNAKSEDPTIVNTNDRTPFLKELLSGHRCPFMVNSDSKFFLECLERFFIKNYSDYVPLLITSETISRRDTCGVVEAFIKNPNSFIERFRENNPGKFLIVLASPTFTSGNSIDGDYFRFDFHCYSGILSAKEIIQKIARIRDSSCKRFIFVRDFIFGDDENLSSIPKYNREIFTRFSQFELNSIGLDPLVASSVLIDLKACFESPFFIEGRNLQSIKNHEKFHFRDCVKTLLNEHNYSVTDAIEESVSLPDFVAVKREYSDHLFGAITNADDTYTNNPKLLKDAKPKNADEVYAIEKGKIVARLPGIHESDSWCPDFVKFYRGNRGAIRGIENYFLLTHPDILNRLSVMKYYRLSAAVRSGELAGEWREKIPRKPFFSALGKILISFPNDPLIPDAGEKELSFAEWLSLSVSKKLQFDDDSPAIRSVFEQCKKLEKSRGGSPFSRSVGTDPIRWVGWLVRLFGFDWVSRRHYFGGEEIRKYSIVSFSNEKMPGLASDVANAIETRLCKIADKSSTVDWSTVFARPLDEGGNDVFSAPSECDSANGSNLYCVSVQPPSEVVDFVITQTPTSDGQSAHETSSQKSSTLIQETGEWWGYVYGCSVAVSGYKQIYWVSSGFEKDGAAFLTLLSSNGDLWDVPIGFVFSVPA